jgi:Ethanolamine utilization protein EutJ (predicted chaperonin)
MMPVIEKVGEIIIGHVGDIIKEVFIVVGSSSCGKDFEGRAAV